jgi:alkane 1-monooxygenase
MFHELKYGTTFTIYVLAFLSLYLGGYWTLSPVIYAFGLLPLLELLIPPNAKNFTAEEEEKENSKSIYDWLLYLNVPFMYIVLLGMLYQVTYSDFEPWVKYMMMSGAGVVLGSIGINVGHELGHRKTAHERIMSKLLLLPNLYMHFIIEHNYGHHKHVSTPKDPASSRYGESLYAFWVRTIRDSWKSAWEIETGRVKKAGKSIWSWENEMLRFMVFQTMYLVAVTLVFGWVGLLAALVAALTGILLLETVNYIEHYGLVRREVSPGVYEPVKPWHSWNADYPIGRLYLYELTRHSDHHYRAARKYQILRHFDESPQLPTGYPGMMLLSLVPPLWFRVMNPRVRAVMEAHAEAKAQP